MRLFFFSHTFRSLLRTFRPTCPQFSLIFHANLRNISIHSLFIGEPEDLEEIDVNAPLIEVIAEMEEQLGKTLQAKVNVTIAHPERERT